jgi:hypothetical protein
MTEVFFSMQIPTLEPCRDFKLIHYADNLTAIYEPNV